MKECRMAIRQFAVTEEFDLGTSKADKERWMGYCKADRYPWRITARLMADKIRTRINKIEFSHTCTLSSCVVSAMASVSWVTRRSEQILRTEPNIGCKELQKKLQEEYNVIVGYHTIWRSKERTLKNIYGSWVSIFRYLFNFKAEIEKRCPRSIVDVGTKVVEGKVYFHRFFMALRPCIDGFIVGCRPYISIDSTALNEKWNGHLASCTTLDGHNWMYPIAFGFIDGETEDNWS